MATTGIPNFNAQAAARIDAHQAALRAAAFADGAIACPECRGERYYERDRRLITCFRCSGAGYVFPRVAS